MKLWILLHECYPAEMKTFTTIFIIASLFSNLVSSNGISVSPSSMEEGYKKPDEAELKSFINKVVIAGRKCPNGKHYIKRMKLEDSDEFKDFCHCLLNRLGLISGSKINKTKAVKMFKKLVHNYAEPLIDYCCIRADSNGHGDPKQISFGLVRCLDMKINEPMQY
ncbi:hypothetical protein R5R35_010595 [Gryllus longicercus]|uniref:Odorant-binding protein n=1 Tax=Gryllus longicercus TaxID=2509291 RepID=A0AAN9VC32_9ORTH